MSGIFFHKLFSSGLWVLDSIQHSLHTLESIVLDVGIWFLALLQSIVIARAIKPFNLLKEIEIFSEIGQSSYHRQSLDLHSFLIKLMDFIGEGTLEAGAVLKEVLQDFIWLLVQYSKVNQSGQDGALGDDIMVQSSQELKDDSDTLGDGVEMSLKFGVGFYALLELFGEGKSSMVHKAFSDGLCNYENVRGKVQRAHRMADSITRSVKKAGD